jgi:serine/threonine-protein kinase
MNSLNCFDDVQVLRSEYLIDFSALEAVVHEGQVLCGLRHPNVIEGYRVELEPQPRIVMQHLRGQSLTNTFFQGNYDAFSLDDFVEVVSQVADALTYVHEQGLLHLDVKPSNVMCHSGHATLFDFSVADEYSPGDTLHNKAGTVEYMAPEQTYRLDLGYATDVFGLGVVFYRLLTGGELPFEVEKRPRPGDDDDDIRRQLEYEVEPRPPSSINQTVPTILDDVTIKAIHPDIDQRYQTPADFKQALQESL